MALKTPLTPSAPSPQAQPASAWQLQPGDELADGLVARRLLGGGRDFEAYLAFDPRRYTLVVAKVARPDVVASGRARHAIEREARALRRADHPAVARLFAARPDGALPYLSLEYVEGPRLSTLVRRNGPLPIEQVLPLGLQLASALHYFAALGLVHLDIKPKNIIMSGPPRLIDFSVARDAAEAADLVQPVGTRTYMAPEQAAPHEDVPVGPAADVWGLGTVLYEAVAGTPAFPTDGPVDHPQLVMEAPPLPGRVPAALDEIVMAALERRPLDRPQPREISDALGELVAAQPRRMVLSRLRPGIRVPSRA